MQDRRRKGNEEEERRKGWRGWLTWRKTSWPSTSNGETELLIICEWRIVKSENHNGKHTHTHPRKVGPNKWVMVAFSQPTVSGVIGTDALRRGFWREVGNKVLGWWSAEALEGLTSPWCGYIRSVGLRSINIGLAIGYRILYQKWLFRQKIGNRWGRLETRSKLIRKFRLFLYSTC